MVFEAPGESNGAKSFVHGTKPKSIPPKGRWRHERQGHPQGGVGKCQEACFLDWRLPSLP